MKNKGRLSWLIPILEIIVAAAYLFIAYKGIIDSAAGFDLVGMFEAVRGAMLFLIIATVVITILCFIPVFRSKANRSIAIWNIIWIIFTIVEIS